MEPLVGLDIGGATLKAADGLGDAASLPFALWQAGAVARLPARLRDLVGSLTSRVEPRTLAVTMTGELCDCFATKAEGVAAILQAVERAFPESRLRVWRTDAQFADVATARRDAWRTAAANWLALACYVGEELLPRGHGLLIDIGSTTTDVIPIRDGRPVPAGLDDPGRLASGELVYFGVTRTPLCALVDRLSVRGVHYGVMAELFATTQDVFLTTGDLPERPGECDTADGRPATRPHATCRLARMIGSDAERFSSADAAEVAAQVVAAMQWRLASSLDVLAARRLAGRLDAVALAGQGEFLARRALEGTAWHPAVISVGASLGPAVSSAACAHAVACLARRRDPGHGS